MTTTHGGSRPKRRDSDRRGGARPGTGPVVRRIHLDADTARSLRVLTLARRSLGSQVTEVDVVSSLIRQAFDEYSASIEEAGDAVD